jgi:N6-adenosine-specific RNA methylase IME4
VTGHASTSRVRYRTIVADPPWSYDRTGVTFLASEGGTFTGSSTPYDSMTLGAIADIPVRDWAARDAHLYLWTTQRYVRDAYWIAEAWGFTPSNLLVWCKPPRGWTVGGTFMSTVEFVLFARRGTLKAAQRIDRQWFEWNRAAHSAKPEAFLDLVETVSPAPRLELFARRNRLGWDTWGNESLEHLETARDA